MSEEPTKGSKMGRPKKLIARPLGYAKQVRINALLHDFYTATEHQDGQAARTIADDLTELIESALK